MAGERKDSGKEARGRPEPVRWVSRIGVHRPKPDESAAWEVEHHLSEVADRLIEAGWGATEARTEAERRFGEPGRYRSRIRRVERGRTAMEWRSRSWDFLVDGPKRVARATKRHPGFSIGVVLTLALGIGANATMYGIVDRLLLQPPAHLVDHERVRRLFVERTSTLSGASTLQTSQTFPDFLDLKGISGLGGSAAFMPPREETVGSGAEATRTQLSFATFEFFPLLGAAPRLGRTFTEDEDQPGVPLTALISEEYWARAFASDPGVLGRTLDLSGHAHTIVGVMPRGFTGIELHGVDIWVPLRATHAARLGENNCLEDRSCWWAHVAVRLADGASQVAVEAEATQRHRNSHQEQIAAGRYSSDARVVLGSVIAADGPNASAETRVTRWLAAVSAIVLMIACANVANLLLARGTRQRREIAVRLALGVSRARVVGQMMLESVLIALAGGVVAVGLARWGGSLVRSALLPGVYFPDSAVNGRVLWFTLLASVVAGAMAGLGPALQGSRTDVASELTDASRGSSGRRSRLRGALTVLQAALSVVLLVGAGLFIRSLSELRALDLGLDVDRVLLATLEFQAPDIEDARQTALYLDAERLVSELPVVSSAAVTSVPFMWSFSRRVRVPGLDSLPRLPGGGPYHAGVSPSYFATVGLTVERGRDFEATDREGSPLVTVVSATMARTLWPDSDPIGACLYLGDDADECTTVVGVVQDAARSSFEEDPFMAYYLPLSQLQQVARGLYVRAGGDPDVVAREAATALRGYSSEVRFASVRSLSDLLDPQARAWTLGATLFTVFGALALLLAVIGLYSVLAFDIAQRTRELGIRTALGAEKRLLLANVLAHGVRLAIAGVVAGVVIAYLTAPYAGDLLFRVSPRDPGVLLAVSTVMVLCGVVASLVPGLRATRVDPVVALRSE